MRVWVECYAGHRADERPLRFHLGDRSYQVEEVLDQWYGPEALYFRVRADDGNLYVLCRRVGADGGDWSLEAFRRAAPETPVRAAG